MEQTDSLKIEVVESADELSSLKYQWNELLEQSHFNNIFQRHEFISAWWKHLGCSKKLFVLVAKQNEIIIGIAPLLIEKTKIHSFPVSVVKFIGGIEFGKLDFIYRKGQEQVVGTFMRYLYSRKHQWDVLLFEPILQESPTIKQLASLDVQDSLNLTSSIHSICPYLPLKDNWDDFMLGLKKSTKKNIRRRLKGLEKMGEVQFESFGSKEELNDHLNDILFVEKQSWKGQERVGVFSSELQLDFHKELAECAASNGWLYFSMLKLNDKFIAYQHGFIYENVFYAYNSAFDPAFYTHSPGSLTINYLCQELVNGNISEFDFLNGDQAYKFDWTHLVRRYDRILLFKKDNYGQFLYLLENSIKPFVKTVLEKIKSRKMFGST